MGVKTDADGVVWTRLGGNSLQIHWHVSTCGGSVGGANPGM